MSEITESAYNFPNLSQGAPVLVLHVGYLGLQAPTCFLDAVMDGREGMWLLAGMR
jgi:hypothetical protein